MCLTDSELADENITDKSIKLNWNKVEGENLSYDLKINGMIYKNVYFEKENEKPFFEHDNLNFDTEYRYSIRAVNTKGASDWSDEITVKTKLDRFRNVPKNMTANASSNQPGSEASRAVDGDEKTQWHTAWGSGNVLPHTFEIDMKLAYQLDKLEYVPRPDAGNGTILKYDLDVSLDGKTYKNVITDGTFIRSNETKTIQFNEEVTARYIKLTIKDAVGKFGSAQEFRPYKKDKTEGMVVGENIPNGAIDEEDLLFFASYMGVDTTDTSWDQVSKVDINYNGVIDSYDLMYVAGQLGETQLQPTKRPAAGLLSIRPDKQQLKAGEEFAVEVIGAGMKDINAFNLELEIDPNKYEIVKECLEGSECGERIADSAASTANMLNYSILAGIGNEKQRIMAAFSNKGSFETLEGTSTLAVIKLKAKKDLEFDIPITRSLLVNTSFDTIDEIGQVLKPGEEPGEVEQPEEPKELLMTARDIAVSGEADKMQDGAEAFPRLIDGEISESSLAELKWSITEADGISLPLEVDFSFNSPTELTRFEVFNRPLYTNGKIKALRAKAFDEEGNEYDLGRMEVGSSDKSVTCDLAEHTQMPSGKKMVKFKIIFEESHSGPLMLSVAEVQFWKRNAAN
ncbi:discoidin domain-containing protein [Cytobacillus oceanisediminis]|uniref:discoidin domain-containing protein n=1 Tax=Cytobacillus oceanisediminis TaxID=665099 RepID=UPI0020796B9F|nr:discoidin domain-containing protein [Cytobacillus oceanisediminis]USK46453.1 discoidin domain-containing protein [Cytobacillus oceanisediminis]